MHACLIQVACLIEVATKAGFTVVSSLVVTVLKEVLRMGIQLAELEITVKALSIELDRSAQTCQTHIQGS